MYDPVVCNVFAVIDFQQCASPLQCAAEDLGDLSVRLVI